MLVQINVRAPESARPLLLAIAGKLRDDPAFAGRLASFLNDAAIDPAIVDRLDMIEGRLTKLEAKPSKPSKPAKPAVAIEGKASRDWLMDRAGYVTDATTTPDWAARAASIQLATGESKGRRLTGDGEALFQDMATAGCSNAEIAAVFGMKPGFVALRRAKVKA